MQINIRAKHYEPSDEVKNYVHDKVGGLEKYLSDIKDAYVELEQDTHHQKGDVARAEITLHIVGGGEMLQTQETASDMHEALDMAISKMKIVIERLKGTRNHVDREALRQLRETD